MLKKEKILSIDWGTKRIGMAISDEMNLIAKPLPTLNAKPIRVCLRQIRDIIVKENVKTILVGLPRNMDNSIAISTRIAIKFAKNLVAPLKKDIKLIFIDERLSTREARNLLNSMGENPKKKSGRIDQIVAATMLQDYLDRHQNGKI